MSVSSVRAWAGVCALALCAFIFNTTEFVPVALLSGIGASFSMPVSEVGLMMTIYAWVVALASLPMMLVTRRIERRRLLMFTLLAFGASHVLCGFAGSFAMLMAGRIGIAFAHAVFWSITASLAVRVSPPGRREQGLALLAAGTSIAMVLGIPLGRMVGQWLGWRATFLVIAGCTAAVLIVLRAVLPRLPSERAGSADSLPLLARRPALWVLYALTVVAVTGQFTAYTYVEPFALRVAHFSESATTTLLLVFGGAGIVGTLLFGRFYALQPRGFLLCSIAVLAASLLLLAPAAHAPAALYAQAAVWGIAIIAFTLAMQSRVLHHSSDATDVAMALFSGIYNVGIGGGALLGGRITAHFGLTPVGLVGGVLVASGFVLCAWAVRRLPPTSQAPAH